MTQNQLIILHLVLSRATPTIIYSLVKFLGLQNLSQVYRYTLKDFVNFGIVESKAEKIVVGLADQNLLQKELAFIQQHQISVVTFWCVNYPKLLQEIHIPPVILYCRGNVDLLLSEEKIACVGARKAHLYVRDVVQHIVIPMVHRGWVVVSGGALGADTFAHQLTVDAGGKTIVVVGSGLCHVYPSENKALFDRVVDAGGLIVSCFTMNTRPEAHCFPIRNRIIAGLSRGCIVLQAAAKSGALITAQQALDQGREVFAVPGSIFDPLSIGCHQLLQQGAKLIMSTDDVLSELDTTFVLKNQQLSVISDTSISSGYASGSVEQQILDSLCVAMSADQLMKKVSIDIQPLQDILFALSLDGAIAQDSMGYWKRL